ncbi:hypothetical protein BU15DRAFT_45948 [Melanogaster broomeanus]|nr:hypothetical protein BU15DRAFT_45948 [Melanogaster broomeanus]
MFRVDLPQGSSITPELPPMAELHERNSLLISTAGAVARRESMNSMMSNGSNTDTQYLLVPSNQNLVEPLTPMSVRPFSPSESFAFPKPPAPQQAAAGDWSSNRLSNSSFFSSGGQGVISRKSSAATLIQINTPPRAFTTDLSPVTVLTPTAPMYPPVAVANPAVDPFADPAAQPGFEDIEVVRRPFMPTLDDELSVHPGDRVRVLQVFDDGWAFVEKVVGPGLEHNDRIDRGLIPVDCLREAGQALPAFLAQKRVSSYSVGEEMKGMAL